MSKDNEGNFAEPAWPKNDRRRTFDSAETEPLNLVRGNPLVADGCGVSLPAWRSRNGGRPIRPRPASHIRDSSPPALLACLEPSTRSGDRRRGRCRPRCVCWPAQKS